MKNIDFSKINWRRPFTLRNFMIIALGLSLYAQLDHTAAVFAHLARKVNEGGAHAYSFAVAVELSVLLFVLAGHKRISYAFAVATFLTNLSYYYVQLDGEVRSADAAFAVLMSLLLPGVIVGYSHVIAQRSSHAQAEAKQDEVDTNKTNVNATPDTNEHEHSEAQHEVDTKPDANESALASAYDELPERARTAYALVEAGYTQKQAADEIGTSVRTIQKDLKKVHAVRVALLSTNGSAH